jgi:hypothetical protein
MSIRMTITILVIGAAAFGGWYTLNSASDRTTKAAGESADALVDGVARAYFTGAEASLAVQRSATGSYAGAVLRTPMTLVRADASSYCIQLDRPSGQQHVNGPGGAPVPGPC